MLQRMRLEVPEGGGKNAELWVGEERITLTNVRSIRVDVSRREARLTLEMVGPLTVRGKLELNESEPEPEPKEIAPADRKDKEQGDE